MYFVIMTFFIVIFGFEDVMVYAKIEMDTKQEQQVEELENSIKESQEPKILEFFTVDKNTYKVLSLDKANSTVAFWNCDRNLEKIIVNNEVSYNGCIFKIKYVYEKAFCNSKTSKNISIDDEVLGFCDLDGSFIETIDATFQDQKKLESINFGNIKVVFGENCFKDCNKIENIEIPNNMEVIESECFTRCYNIKNINLSGIKKFNGPSSFGYCNNLKNIGKFNDEVIELPDKTFQYCKNIEIISLNNVAKIGAKCFESCKGLKKDIVTDIKEFGDKCFYKCNFNELYLKKAEKIGYDAFGACSSLKKIRFGNPNIPFLTNNIAEDSSINELVYPLNYTTQKDYMEFLSKLEISKVIWHHNYEKSANEVTQGARLDLLKPPLITREGYKIEGWYREPECINKVNKIADLGEISGSDIVIKDPKLYAKWIAKDIDIPKEEKPSEPGNVNDPKEEKPSEPGNVNDPKEEKPSEPEDVNESKEEKPNELGDADDPKEKNNSNESEDIHNSEDVDNISHKSKKNNNKIQINDFKCVSQDRTNNNVQIVTSRPFTKIIKNNKCIAIYLNSNGKLYYLNGMNYGYKGSIKIKSNNVDDKWYYLKDDESLVVNTSTKGYDVIYYE